MSAKCWVSKGDLITMLGADAPTFMLFLLKKPKVMENYAGLTEQEKADIDDLIDVINQMFSLTPTSGIELDEPMIQGMMSQLNALGIISTATITSINGWVERALSDKVVYAEKKYTLQKLINGSSYDDTWINQNAVPTGVTVVIVEREDNYGITLNGTLPPPAQAVLE